jgi:hypothetical protein
MYDGMKQASTGNLVVKFEVDLLNVAELDYAGVCCDGCREGYQVGRLS